jgi:hypothetical protein
MHWPCRGPYPDVSRCVVPPSLSGGPDLTQAVATAIGSGVGVLGTLVAAGIGVLGLFLVLRNEQQERYRSRLDEALSSAMVTFAERSEALTAWLDEPGRYAPRRNASDITGGPGDAHMQSVVDIAYMAARGKDLLVLAAIADATFAMKLGRTRWQEGEFGSVAGDIRKWRTKQITDEECIQLMRAREKFAKDSWDEVARAAD